MSISRTLRGDPRLAKLARIVTQYCTEIKKGEKVIINGPPVAETLILALYREVLRCGAYPTLRIDLSERLEIFYEEASEHQLDYCPVEDLFIAQNFDVSLTVYAEINYRSLASVDVDKIARVQIARKEVRQTAKDKVRWNLCLFPTDAFAQESGMSTMEFENYYLSACFADEEDPVSHWRELRSRQDTWVAKLEGAKTLQIIGEDTDLTMSVEGRTICNSWGRVNMPCGEIYTSPVEDTVEGTIKFSYPAIYNGREIEELVLRFKRGVVIEAYAKKGLDVIEMVLGLDEGARRVGEIGIGTNYRLNKFTKNMLLDEKMGGTIHLALGDSYTETGGQNNSVIHLDILKDLKKGGQILFDGKIIQENGQFTDLLVK